MSKVYKQINSIAGATGAAFGGGGGGGSRKRRRKTLGPGGGSDPGNSDRAGVLSNRREITSRDVSNAGMLIGGGVGTFATKAATKTIGWAISSYSGWQKKD